MLTRDEMAEIETYCKSLNLGNLYRLREVCIDKMEINRVDFDKIMLESIDLEIARRERLQ